MGEKVAYIRVSTVEQNEARQTEALAGYKMDKVFIEKASGKDTNRPQLQRMLEYIREGDTVFVTELSRLGRSTADLLSIIQQIKDKGADFQSLKEKIETNTPAGKLQLTMLAAIAEFERDMIKERQAEGIAIAKREGKYKGRAQKKLDNIAQIAEKKKMGVAVAKLAKEAGVSRPTLYRLLNDYEEKKKDETSAVARMTMYAKEIKNKAMSPLSVDY